MIRTVHVDIRGPVIIFNGRKYRPRPQQSTKLGVGDRVRVGKVHVMYSRGYFIPVVGSQGPPEIWGWIPI